MRHDEQSVFHGLLLELVAIGLHRPAFEALCAGSPDIPSPPVDRSYLLKILEEEVTRQFGQPFRPIVELVLNAADASAQAGSTVEVTVHPECVEVIDQGEGMDLAAILSRLLIPFATDKDPGKHLGRFGVGFFSVLGYAVAEPRGFHLELETGAGPNAAHGWTFEV